MPESVPVSVTEPRFDPALLQLAGSRNLAALAALKRGGRPQLSMVNYALAVQGDTVTARVSVVDGRAKVANLRRRPECCLYLLDLKNPYRYLEVRGNARIEADYDYAFATNDFVVAVWNDAHNAADCPTIDAYRQDILDGTAEGTANDPTRPAPNNACPPTFGNTDIRGGSYADPTP